MPNRRSHTATALTMVGRVEEARRQKLGAACGMVFALLSAFATFLRRGEVVGGAGYGLTIGNGALPDVLAATSLLVFMGALDAVATDAEQMQIGDMKRSGSATFRSVARLAGGAAVVMLLIAATAEAARQGAPDITASTMKYLSRFANVAAAAPLAVYVFGTSMSLALLDGGGRLVASLGLFCGALLFLRPIGLVIDANGMLGTKSAIGQFFFAAFCLWVALTSIVMLRHLKPGH